MSHRDSIMAVPEGFRVTASTDKCPVAAMSSEERKLYAVQFHPEVEHTEYGNRMLSNFLFGICGVDGNWRMDDFVEESISRLRKELDGRKVLRLPYYMEYFLAESIAKQQQIKVRQHRVVYQMRPVRMERELEKVR